MTPTALEMPAHEHSSTRHASVGLIGCGGRGVLNLANKICELEASLQLKLTAVCDTNRQRREDATAFLEQQLRHTRSIKSYDNADALMAGPDIDAVIITTPQDAHETPFVAAARAGKIIFCDKPLAASRESCLRMKEAHREYGRECIIGFTRRYEHSWMEMHRLMRSGVIGKPRLLLLRSVIPYTVYFHNWHRKKAWSGGLLNEKSAHHFDALNWFAGAAPRHLYAIGGRSVYEPREGYPSRCCECDLDCRWRAPAIRASGKAQDAVGRLRRDYEDDPELRLINDKCVYDPQSDIIDHAITTIQYENGIQAVLFLSIFGPGVEDQETLEVVGDAGRMILTRHSGQINVATWDKQIEIIDGRDARHATSHFGADYRVVESIAALALHHQPPAAGFNDAFLASMMAFAAEDSVAADGKLMHLQT